MAKENIKSNKKMIVIGAIIILAVLFVVGVIQNNSNKKDENSNNSSEPSAESFGDIDDKGFYHDIPSAAEDACDDEATIKGYKAGRVSYYLETDTPKAYEADYYDENGDKVYYYYSAFKRATGEDVVLVCSVTAKGNMLLLDDAGVTVSGNPNHPQYNEDGTVMDGGQ